MSCRIVSHFASQLCVHRDSNLFHRCRYDQGELRIYMNISTNTSSISSFPMIAWLICSLHTNVFYGRFVELYQSTSSSSSSCCGALYVRRSAITRIKFFFLRDTNSTLDHSSSTLDRNTPPFTFSPFAALSDSLLLFLRRFLVALLFKLTHISLHGEFLYASAHRSLSDVRFIPSAIWFACRCSIVYYTRVEYVG